MPTNAAADHAVLRRVLRLLERIEEHPGSGVLAFRVGKAGRGNVVVSNGRICIVADTAKPWFSDLLRQSNPRLAALFLEARERAQRERRRFGELLLELGAAQVEEIRQFLRHQCALGLVSMAETHIDDEVDFYALALESPLRWAADLGAAAADYNERLTFSLMEVYEVAAGLLDAQRDDRASALFAAFSSTSTLSLLLWRDPQGEAVSLPVAFKGPLSSMADLRRLAYSTDRLLVSPTLRAAGLIPDVVLFGASWNDVACVVGPARMVLICGSDVGQKAQLANSALRVS